MAAKRAIMHEENSAETLFTRVKNVCMAVTREGRDSTQMVAVSSRRVADAGAVVVEIQAENGHVERRQRCWASLLAISWGALLDLACL